MTKEELLIALEEYDDNETIKIAHYGLQGVITDLFDIDIVGDYTDDEEPYVLLG
ncbi:hypothetical protein [Bacillus mycoides]|uniref:hypothetical protein n=1 Tax=Bacillus mycoides TaxID=1405 RepID=UPI001C009099|nr:hypothetical protein [Bacillus mycoides]